MPNLVLLSIMCSVISLSDPTKMHTRLMLSINGVCTSCWESNGITMCGMMIWDGNQTTSQLLSKHFSLFRIHCMNARWKIPRKSQQLPLGELEETNGTPMYHMDEDYPALLEIQSPWMKQSMWLREETTTPCPGKCTVYNTIQWHLQSII